MKAHGPSLVLKKLNYAAIIEEADTIFETVCLIKDITFTNNWHIAACCCGGDAGVDLADALCEELGLPTNGTAVKNRRDKKVQQNIFKAAALRSVRQTSGTCFNDVKHFPETEHYPLIVQANRLGWCQVVPFLCGSQNSRADPA